MTPLIALDSLQQKKKNLVSDVYKYLSKISVTHHATKKTVLQIELSCCWYICMNSLIHPIGT